MITFVLPVLSPNTDFEQTAYKLYANLISQFLIIGGFILYGILYTVVLVPYGSLASVMTVDEGERSLLSIFRSIGGGIGSIPTTMLFPLFVQVDNKLAPDRLLIAMIILAALMIIMYFLSFIWTKERIASPVDPPKINVLQTIKSLIKIKLLSS